MAIVLDGTLGLTYTGDTAASNNLAVPGNVGVGTSSPSAKLEIVSSGTPTQIMRNTNASSYTSLRLYNDQNIAVRALEIDYYGSSAAGGERAELATTGAYPMLFLTNNTERVRIDSSGNLKLSTAGTAIQNSSGRPILNQTGSALQVIQATDNTYRSVSAGGATETDWVAATITRTSTASKILCIFSGSFATSAATDCAVRLNSSLDGRLGEGTDATRTQSLYSPGTDKGGTSTLGGGSAYTMFNSHFSHLYTPSNTTATITMTVRIWTEVAQTLYPNGDGWRGGGSQAHSTGSHLILMEIAT